MREIPLLGNMEISHPSPLPALSDPRVRNWSTLCHAPTLTGI